MPPEFSPAYHRALLEAQRHHQSSKTYSGKFLRPHAPAIKEIIDRLGVKRILDYGCGKGEQYRWVSHGDDASIPKGLTIEGYWGISAWKYDPAWEPYSVPPVGEFDLVICTHVLGSIPLPDLPAVRDEIFKLATKAVYIAEKLGPVRKQIFSRPGDMPRMWGRNLWKQFLETHPGHLEVHLSTRERLEDDSVSVIRGTV